MTNKLIHCLRNQPLTPEGHTDPVTYFAFVLREPDVTLISNHETDTSYRMSCTSQNNRMTNQGDGWGY